VDPKPRDHLRSRRVANAMVSPLGLAAGGGAAAVSVLAGLPVAAAAGIGVAAWATRVAVAIPRRQRKPEIDPFTVGEPWRGFVLDARRARRRYHEALGSLSPGPLRDRLGEVGTRIDDATGEVWDIARAGHGLSGARRHIDTLALGRQLEALEAAGQSGGADPLASPLEISPSEETAASLRSQLESAARLDEAISSTERRLQALTARLGEVVTRAIEVSAQPGADVAVTSLGEDLTNLVDQMEALRLALGETGPPPPPELR